MISLLCLHIFLFFGNAQSNDQSLKQSRDSLKLELELVEDSHREVQLLNEYARLCYYSLDVKEGLIAAQKARELTDKLNYDAGEVMALQTAAAFFWSRPQFHEYLETKARERSETMSNSPSEFANILVPPGAKNFDDLSIDTLEQWLAYFDRNGDNLTQAHLASEAAGVYYDLQDWKTTLRLLLKADRLYDPYDLDFLQFVLRTYTLYSYRYAGEIETADSFEIALVESVVEKQFEEDLDLIDHTLALTYFNTGRYELAIEYFLQNLPELEEKEQWDLVADSWHLMGIAYESIDRNSMAVDAYREWIYTLEQTGNQEDLHQAQIRIIFPLIAIHNFDEARRYMDLARQGSISGGEQEVYLQASLDDAQGQIMLKQEQFNEAISYFDRAWEGFEKAGDQYALPFPPLRLSECYLRLGRFARAAELARESIALHEKSLSTNSLIPSTANLLLAEAYDSLDQKSIAYDYLRKHQQIEEEVRRSDEEQRLADAEIRMVLAKSEKLIAQLEEDQFRTEQENKTQRLWIFSITGALLSALLVAYLLYLGNKRKQKSNALLEDQKREVELALDKLKTTQKQLIHSEKMASLGSLTAGIAHEIQNPLNFVNNFSELNEELVEDLLDEIKNQNWEEVAELAESLKLNEKKIKQHGKRAEGIVRSMLQHSRSGVDSKELIDINVLADEYLRLAYHGLRARDKSFNARMDTHFAEDLPEIKVVPQQIGRVLLNLITNAFHAVSERASRETAEYYPTVGVDTSVSELNGDKIILVKVEDNGDGIKDENLEKIFQPFFSTKPTGAGTGLGLSISYDIIQAHGGELKVLSEPGKGTVFTIELPVLKNQKT